MTAETGSGEEVRDRTKLVWAGIGVAILAMVVILAITARQVPMGTQVRARHILITYDRGDPTDRKRALDLITDLRKRIMNGESFKKLAKEYSEDPLSAARGGDLGFEPKGIFDDAFEQYVWNAPIGEVSDVVVSSHGFHLIRVEQRYLSEAEQYKIDLEQRAVEMSDKDFAVKPEGN